MFKQRNHILNNFKKVSSNFTSKTKSKLQNNVLIKPSSGEYKCIDYKFQTDEEIETQKECEFVKIKENLQKKNNSFSNLYSGLQINERSAQKKKKLQFFHCDSIAIRPSCHQVILKQIQRSKSSKQQLSYESDQCSQIKKSITEDRTQIADKNHWEQSKDMVKSLRPSRLKNRIFEKKGPSHLLSTIPKALMPYHIQKQRIERMSKQEQFQQHIIFQTDQITQCCL